MLQKKKEIESASEKAFESWRDHHPNTRKLISLKEKHDELKAKVDRVRKELANAAQSTLHIEYEETIAETVVETVANTAVRDLEKRISVITTLDDTQKTE